MIIILNIYGVIVSKDVTKKPFEYPSITVNGDVNFVIFRDLLKALVEVLHVTDKYRARELKVSLLILIVVNHMYHYSVSYVQLTQSLKD